VSDSTSQLFKRIQDDMKAAMLAKDQIKLSTLRILKSAIKNLEIANPGKPISDDAILGLIQKQIKQRQDSITAYEKGNRKDLAEKEKIESDLLSSYVPEQMDDAELEKLVQEILQKNSIQSKKEFGKAMNLLQEAAKGRVDNRRMSAYLQKVLS